MKIKILEYESSFTRVLSRFFCLGFFFITDFHINSLSLKKVKTRSTIEIQWERI